MITSPLFYKQRYAVVGLGLSGCATAAALQASGATVFIWDDDEKTRQTYPDLVFTSLTDMPWSSLDGLILSPGIPHQYPQPHLSATRAQAAGVPILCDIDLLAQACPNNQFIGVTGTNGKSTTTALLGHMLAQADQKVQVGGNIGVPALALNPQQNGVFVLELSSYQLERVPHLKLDRGVLLNITPDHLSRHGGMAGYIRSKQAIFDHRSENFQGVLSLDDAFCQAIYTELKDDISLATISFGDAGSATLQIKEGRLFEEKQERMTLFDHPYLKGLHNQQNLAAAYGVGRSLNLDPAVIKRGLAEFKGLPHRLQVLQPVRKVTFVNDSKATNVMAAAQALACFDNIYWILGGQAKETGLQGLEIFFSRIRHAFLIGAASAAFAQTFEELGVAYSLCETLDGAVPAAFQAARQSASVDPVVLLSPVCASWDQFRSFEHRGETFCHLVDHLLDRTEK